MKMTLLLIPVIIDTIINVSFSLHSSLPSSLSSQHLSEEIVHQIIGEAVEVEKAFICDALPVSLIGMNSGLMREYIEYCADRYNTCRSGKTL